MTGVAFSHLKFPDYEFREYPKWVKDADGKDVLVETKADELNLLTVKTAAPVNMLVQTSTEETSEGEGAEEISEGEGTEETSESEETEETEQPPVEEVKTRGRRRRAA